jgi:ribose transport system substrate-binding protein
MRRRHFGNRDDRTSKLELVKCVSASRVAVPSALAEKTNVEELVGQRGRKAFGTTAGRPAAQLGIEMQRIWTGTIIAAAMMATVVACSSSQSGGGSTSAPPSSSGATSSQGSGTTSAQGAAASTCLSTATKRAAAFKASPKPNYPTVNLDAAKAKGKNIWIIQSAITPLTTDVTKAFQQAGSVAGVKTTVINGAGSVSTTVTGTSQAVAQHAAAIVLFAVPISEVKSQIAQAKAAGIPVIDTFNGDDAQNLTSQGVFGHVSEDPTAAGKTVADWMLAYSKCNLDTAMFGASVITPHALSVAGAMSEIKTLCTSCKSTFVNLDLTKLVTDAGTKAQETLRRDAKINIVMSCFDGAVPLIAAGMKQSGVSNNVKIISMDGTDASVGLIRSGKSPQIADVALPPASYIGWAYMDQALRSLTGVAAANGVLPYRLIDTSNIGTSGTDLFPSFSSYKSQYEKLWGVSS